VGQRSSLERVQCLAVTVDALADDHGLGVRSDHRRVPELLRPLGRVAEVHLHQRGAQLRAGVVSQVILIGVQGAPQDKLAQVSNALVERLAQAPEFAYASNGAQERMEADGKFLLRNRYLLSPGVTAERFTASGLRTALQDDLDLLASSMGTLVSGLLPRDPTGEFLRLLETFQLAGGPERREGVWFSGDGTRAVLIAQTRAKGFDIDAQEHALQRLRELFGDVSKEHGAPAAQLIAVGPGVFAVGTRAAIKEDVSRISALAVVLVSCLFFTGCKMQSAKHPDDASIRAYRDRISQCEALKEFAVAEEIREILRQEQEHAIDLATALGEDVPKI